MNKKVQNWKKKYKIWQTMDKSKTLGKVCKIEQNPNLITSTHCIKTWLVRSINACASTHLLGKSFFLSHQHKATYSRTQYIDTSTQPSTRQRQLVNVIINININTSPQCSTTSEKLDWCGSGLFCVGPPRSKFLLAGKISQQSEKCFFSRCARKKKWETCLCFCFNARSRMVARKYPFLNGK